MPNFSKDKREEIISKLASALINWRITSNQARIFNLTEIIASAISDNANQIAYAIRGELMYDRERPTAVPKIDEITKADIFVTPITSSFIAGSIGSADALKKGEAHLIKLLSEFDYKNQIKILIFTMKIENIIYIIHGYNKKYRTVVGGISDDFSCGGDYWSSASW